MKIGTTTRARGTGCAMVEIAFATTPAAAQTATETAALATSTDSIAAMPGDGLSLTDIVVTAQKPETNLQETSLLIAAFSGEDLRKQGKNTVQEVLRGIPNARVER